MGRIVKQFGTFLEDKECLLIIHDAKELPYSKELIRESLIFTIKRCEDAHLKGCYLTSLLMLCHFHENLGAPISSQAAELHSLINTMPQPNLDTSSPQDIHEHTKRFAQLIAEGDIGKNNEQFEELAGKSLAEYNQIKSANSL